MLRGEPGARRDVVLLNAGAARSSPGAVESIEDGIERAALIIDAGLAMELLGKLRDERRVADAAKAAAEGAPGMSSPSAAPEAARSSSRSPSDGARTSGARSTSSAATASPALPAAPVRGPSPRRLAAPGLHLIAEVKRRSPSAGDIAASDDVIARARAYAAGGASAISVLCEPHWFGGSVDDLRAVRSPVAVPVLAKDFVVDSRQLDLLRAAGADLVLLLAVLHPPARLAELAAQARDLGLEPLIEAHDADEIEAALAAGARLVGVNNRDLRTLDVDPEQAVAAARADPGRPAGDRRVRRPRRRDHRPLARHRLRRRARRGVADALARPAAAARAFVAAGRDPRDLTADARAPFVKICGVTDAAGILAAVRAGADAIGLNFAPGTPRELSIEEGVELARLARAAATAGAAGPRIVLVTADLPPRRCSGSSPPWTPTRSSSAATSRRQPSRRPDGPPGRRSVRPDDDPGAVVALARTYLDAGAERILLDTAGGQHPGGTGVRVDAGLAAAVAREVPVTLAGGLHAGNVADALLAIPAVGVDVASGTDAPREDGRRPRKDPFRVAVFTKRARDARRHRPNVAFGPTPVHAGLLEADGAGRWGKERDFGGRYVPETLVAALEQLEAAYAAVRHDPRFWAELDDLLVHYVGRPTPLYRADRLADARVEAGACRRAAGAASVPQSRSSGSTSSARTSPTPVPTRSTTRSARPC